MATSIRSVSAAALPTAHYERWREIHRMRPHLASPYLHPQFTRAVAKVRQDACVTIVEQDGVGVGYFPHHRKKLIGAPIGENLNDVQAIVCVAEADLDIENILLASGLQAWDFDHLLTVNEKLAPFARGHAVSPIVDLQAGFDDWFASRSKTASRFKQLARKRRNLERDVGPLRVEENAVDASVFERIIALKRQKCQQSGIPDFMSWGWVAGLLRDLRDERREDFEGVVTACYAGDALVAAHFGMRTDRVWHWWFPVYEAQYAKYSPGSHLLIEVCRLAAARGITSVDLGKGTEPYKLEFANAAIDLMEGTAFRSTASGWTLECSRRALRAGKRKLKRPALALKQRILASIAESR